MSYTTVEKVGKVCGLAFSSTSKPTTTTDVDGFIADIEAEMHGALEDAGYDPDATSAGAQKILQMYASLGASAMVMQASKRVEDASIFQRRYDAWLALVRDGKASGLVRVGASGALPSSRYTRSPSTYPAPAFKRGEVQF